MRAHPDAETLAQFVEGTLERSEIAAIVEHVRTCEACQLGVATASDALASRQRGLRMPLNVFRLATAATIVIAIGGSIAWLVRPRSPVARLVALAPRSERIAEARLSGGFEWARYRGHARASDPSETAQRLKLAGAAGELIERADREKSASLEHAAGVGLVLIDTPLDAVARLRAATNLDPKNARAWSDLAAAQYAAASRLDRASLFPEALVSADAALRIDPALPEARFNRALTLERLGLAAEAREAWEHYLAVDSSSPWAAEARQRKARLPATTGDREYRRDEARLERAALEGDAALLLQLVNRHRELSRTTAEVLTLGKWGEAVRRGDAAEASRLLTIARSVGESLQRVSGESLLRDAVAAIDSAAGARRSILAEAHTLYLRGRLAYSRHEPAAAEPELRSAADRFAAGDDPMALVARYYAANARFDQHDIDGARKELLALHAEALRRPRCIALRALVAWELALCAMTDDDWQGALPLVVESRDAFARLGETSSRGFLDALYADALLALGRPDDGWLARIRAFEALSVHPRADRLPASLDGAARMALRAGHFAIARSMLHLEEAANRTANNDVLLANTLVREAALSARVGDDDAAMRESAEALAIARRIEDPAFRTRALTDAGFAMGAASLRSNPRAAVQHLTSAIDGYRRMDRPLFLPDALLLRSRAHERIGERDAAAADLDTGIAAIERHPIRYAEAVVGVSIVEAATELFHDAIRLSLDRGDAAAALAYAERSRTRLVQRNDEPGTVTASDLQRRLAGSGAAVLEIVALRDEVASFCVTERAISAARSRIPRERLTAIIDADDAGALYDALIRPLDAAIARATLLMVIADPLLDGVAFPALWDSARRQYLIERVPVAIASNRAALRVRSRAHEPQSVLAIALPSTAEAAALPHSREELGDVLALYPRSVELAERSTTFASLRERAAQSDVIHIAGHTERLGGAGEAALVFRGERVSWRKVAAADLPSKPLVVLAACETLRRPRSPQTLALSLGAGFLAAGATDVIGTLRPIADAEARDLFARVHRHLRMTPDPAHALRRAQIEALSDEANGRASLPWRAVALLTNHIPRDRT